MEEFSGYIASSTDARAAAMASDRRPPSTTLIATAQRPSTHLSAAPALSARSTDGKVMLVLTGRPRFTEPRLQAHAASHGAPAAAVLGYAELGERLPTVLVGSFALALIDSHRSSALLATDRFATLPIYYAAASDGALAFATTGSAALRELGATAEIDPQALFDYVFMHVVPSPHTIYRGVQKLGPAQRLVWSQGRLAPPQLWWSSPFAPEHGHGVERNELSQELHGALAAAIDASADRGPTACFLSGGLDSSTVVGFTARSGRPTHAYTIGFDEQGYDESMYARIAAQHFGAELRLHYLTPAEVAAAIPTIAQAYDEPFGNSSAIPTYYCAKLARADGHTVMLAGDGGDELFGGNERYAREKIFLHYSRLPASLRRALIEPLAQALRRYPGFVPGWKLWRYVSQARLDPAVRFASVFDQLKGMAPEFIFAGDFLQLIDTQAPQRELAHYYDAAPATAALDRMLYLDWKITLADNDLCKVGQMCACNGVAVRYPMLDERVVALSQRVPADAKLAGGELRAFYKHAMADFLPAQIIDKKKHGFGLPFGEWLKTKPQLGEITYPALAALGSRGIFRREFIDHLVHTHRDGHASYYGSMVWALMILELWIEAHDARLPL
jgi:asparagine synthase (glutamine-hydrolysing)